MVYCTSFYGKTIFGESGDVADACLRDHLWCKGYQYSNNHGYGHLCSSMTYGWISGNFLNCKKIEGKTPNIT